MNYYVLLGISRNASREAVRRAFRARARECHPDAGRDSSAEKFRDVVDAYATLSDPARRAAYDRTLDRPPLQIRTESITSDRVTPEPLVPIRRTHVILSPRATVFDEDYVRGDDVFEILQWFFPRIRPR